MLARHCLSPLVIVSLAFLGCAPARISDGLLQHREVEQRFSTEEREVRDLLPARLREQELDALFGGLLAHELGRVTVFGIDDLVLAVLVAVGARQVALVGHVQDHRREREVGGRQVVWYLLFRRADLSDRTDLGEFLDGNG